MMRAFGVGGPTVDTVLDSLGTRPGLALQGRIEVFGGDHDALSNHLVLTACSGFS